MSGLKNQLAQRAQTPTNGDKPVKIEDRVRHYLEAMKPQMMAALPRHMTADRLARIALTTIRTTPELLDCNMQSLLGSVMQAAQLGLEPGMLGHCYIVPYGKKATFIIGYRGMIDLARRSGNIKSIRARVVYENDDFRLTYGLNETLEHTPWHMLDGVSEAGNARGAYMVAEFVDGGYQIHYMPVAEIEAHRKRSASANKGPWVTDWEEMAKKTVVRAAWKWLPISVEIMQRVEERDGTIVRDVTEDGMINVTPDFDGIDDETRVIEPVPDEDDSVGAPIQRELV